MEELRINSFPVHRLRQSSADRVSKKNSSFDWSRGMSPQLKLCHSRSSSPPASLSPPSTPSPRCPVVHPDSTSTASAPPPLEASSPSHASSHTYLCQSKPQPFCEDDEQLPPAQSDISSPSPWHVASTRQCTAASEVAIARTSVESVSLEKHLHHCDTGQEAAMQSFILDRFLPAAKTVAADHDCTLYKSHATMPSTTLYASNRNSPKKTLSPYSIKSRVPRMLNASKGITRSHPLYQDDSETESFNHEAATKSCGSFCVGLKTALSRVHKVVHNSAHTASRSKIRATPSFIHGTSSDGEEDVVPKVKVLTQRSTWKQGSAYAPASVSYSSSSPGNAVVEEQASRYMAPASVSYSSSSPGNAIVEGQASRYMASSRSGPLRHQAGCNCVPPCDKGGMRPHWDHFKETPGGMSLEGCPLRNASQNTASGGFILDRAASKGCPACRNAAEGASGEISLEGRPLLNASQSQSIVSGRPIQDPASRAASKGSPAYRHAIDDALKDQDCTEDDEYEFHDALSKFDSSTSTPADDAPPMTCRSPKSQKASGSPSKKIIEEDRSVDAFSYCETPHAGVWSSKALGCDANHQGHSEALLGEQEEEGEESTTHRVSCERRAFTGSAHTKATMQKPGQAPAHSGFPRTMNSAYSLNPSSPIFKCQSTTPNGHEKCASPPVLGWPLGITWFQGGTKKKASTQEYAKNDDRCTASPISAFTDSNVSSPLFSPNASPLVPPSPTGSWLGKAMALNASKPSTLATLQQKEKSASVRKLEFTVLDAKKEVRWEDVVKGSQMQPEQFRLSEEIRHNHPSNRSAMKPVRL